MTLGKYIKSLKDTSHKNVSEIIKELDISRQYFYDVINDKRVPSARLLKKMGKVFQLNENDKKMYDLASESYKEKKVPADIEEFIINNKDIQDRIRKMMKETKYNR